MATPAIPLTTTFTPAPACLTDIHWASQSAWFVLGEYNTNCMPHASGVSLPNPTLSSYYSPAVYCPSGYTVACSSEVGPETRAVCCPQLDNIPVLSKNSFTCYSSPPAWGAWSSYGCAFAMGTAVSEGPIRIVVTDGAGTRTTSTSLTNINEGLNAYSVQIRWKAADLASITSSSSASSSTSGTASVGSSVGGAVSSTLARSTATSARSTSSATNTQSGGQSSTSSGLSTGAIVAIGVIIPVVVIIGLVAGFFFWRRSKKSRAGTRQLHSPDSVPPLQAMSNEKYEMAAKAPQRPHEMADTSIGAEKYRY